MGFLILAAFVAVFSAAAIDEFVGFSAIAQDLRNRRIARRQAARRRRIVERVRIADVRLAAEQERAKRQMNDAVNQMREQVRNVLGQTRPRFDISQVFTENKLLIVPLNKGLLGAESAHWIGSLLVARIWETLLAQAAVPATQRPTVVIALDEFQDYTHLGTDLGEALSQARALGGAFILNHQYLDQLAAPAKDAVLSHARSRIVFTPSHKDAPEPARMTGGELQAIDFTSLGQYEVYLDLQRDGRSSGWASGKTEAPCQPTSDPADLRRRSREAFGAQPPAPASVKDESVAPSASDGPKVGKRRRSS